VQLPAFAFTRDLQWRTQPERVL